MTKFEQDYLNILENILENGTDTKDRTSVGNSRQLFGEVITHEFVSYDTEEGTYYELPFVQSRTFGPKLSFEEWNWMMRGSTDARELQEKNVHIWDGNSTREFLDSRGLYDVPEHHIGKAYGHQFRKLKVDQIQKLFQDVETSPNSRRFMVNLWNPEELDEMALEPCAYNYNFVNINGKLNLLMNMRSADVTFGVPYNLSFGTYFLLSMCRKMKLEPGKLMLIMANTHIYENQIPIVKEVLKNKVDCRPVIGGFNNLVDIDTVQDLENLEYSDFELIHFTRGPKIGNVEMAV